MSINDPMSPVRGITGYALRNPAQRVYKQSYCSVSGSRIRIVRREIRRNFSKLSLFFVPFVSTSLFPPPLPFSTSFDLTLERMDWTRGCGTAALAFFELSFSPPLVLFF